MNRRFPNIFVLTTGRAGSTSFAHMCLAIKGYSSGHETLNHLVGDSRFNYPKYHIEVDNRLAWHLGQLQKRYGKNAYYVFLRRNADEVIDSFASRAESGIMAAFGNTGIVRECGKVSKEELARFYVETVESNISEFLRDKAFCKIDLESIDQDFQTFVAKAGLKLEDSNGEAIEAPIMNLRVGHRSGWLSHLRTLRRSIKSRV